MSYKQFQVFVAGSLLAAASAVYAQKTPADISVETFFKREQYRDMVLSPNGKRLAAAIPLKGRDNLVVIDLDKRTRKIITGFEDNDVAAIRWINNDRICFRAADGQDASGQFNYLGTFCVDHDGENPRNFTKLGVTADAIGGYTRIDFVGLTHDGTPDVFAAMSQRSKDSTDVYRFNTMSGKFQLLTFDSPGFVRRWVLDHNYVPRVAVSQPPQEKDGRMREVWYRDSADAKWELIAKAEMVADTIPVSGDFMIPIGFEADNKTLLIASDEGRDKAAIYRFDPKTKKRELLFEHPLIDVEGGLVWSRTQKKFLGVRYDAEKPAVKWFDPEIDKLQKMIDATFPKTYNQIVFPTETDTRALVISVSDVQPAIYHLLDRTKPSVEMVAQTRDWIDPDLMAERKFVQYKARDGLLIPAWLTLPKGYKGGQKVPLIVNIHGGPWVRAYDFAEWGRWPEAQFFASRGYAVLEPEPRGSAGFGKKHLLMSFKQWGQTMQDDITDGALHLVKEGIVDEKRMCLHGGSYGGYATAMGLAKDPDIWRCGSPFVAVTDLSTFQNLSSSDISRNTDFFQGSFKRVVGDSDADKEMFMRYSPAQQASRIKAPVLLAMGSEDFRVPLAHGNALRDAIQRSGGQVEYVVYNNEGHGFNKDENVVDFYKRLERFFARNLKAEK